MAYRCSRCGEWHDELPFAFHVPQPTAWLPEHEADGDSWLPGYEPSTLSLKTMVHTRPLGLRPLVELEPTDHPLAVEQREGITLARVQEIAEQLLHAA